MSQASREAPSGAAVPFTVYTPAQVRERYNFPTNSASGQTVGVLGWGPQGTIGVNLESVAEFFQRQGLPVPSITIVPIDGQTNNPEAKSSELHMDCEIVGTFAQGAAIRVYVALGNATDIAAAIAQAVADGCWVTTCSYGGPCAPWTSEWSPEAVQTIDSALQAAAAAGVTTCFASGDSGAAKMAYPAASPFALAVGGTFVPQSSGVEQVWWNYPASGSSAGRTWWASGGGVAPWAAPEYQQAISPTSFSCCNKEPHTGRGTPDVAALAQGNGPVWDGTSACSPFWAALLATINAGLGFSVGFIHDILYAQAASAGAVNKIATGNNIPPGTDCDPPEGQFPPCGYTASTSGWDACTGLGTPNGQNLMKLLGTAITARRAASKS